MAKVAVVTDSTAYLPNDLVNKYKITVVPQVLIWDKENFLDGIDIQPIEFYQRLKNAKIMPSTSQATPSAFYKIYSFLHEQDFQILAILVSSDLSGTISSAVQAKEMLPGITAEIFDSRTTSMGMGFQVLEAAKAAADGASLADCLHIAEEVSKHVGVIFAVDTLEFLHRGGRIGGASRYLGTALNIKPILEVVNGKVEAIERVRTRKKSLERVVELVAERSNGHKVIKLATLHANSLADAGELLVMGQKRLDCTDGIVTEVSPVVGTHADPVQWDYHL